MTAPAADIDGAIFRHVLGHYPTGVCVVTALDRHGRAAGMVVGSFTSVSLDPPLVAFLPDRASTSWPRIEHAGKFCINVLSGDQHDLCRRLSGKSDDKFTGVPHRLSAAGSPILDDVIAWIDCTLETVHGAGDHFIAIGRVVGLEAGRADEPLLFHRGRYGRFLPLSPVQS